MAQRPSVYRNLSSQDSTHSTVGNIVCSGSKSVGGYYGAAYGKDTVEVTNNHFFRHRSLSGATAGAAIVSSLIPIFGPLIGGVLGGTVPCSAP